MFGVVERNQANLAFRIHLDDQRLGFRPTTARCRQIDIFRYRIYLEVIDNDLVGGHAHQSSNFRVDTLYIDRGGFGSLSILGIDRNNFASNRISDEENSVRSEGQGAGRCKLYFACGQIYTRRRGFADGCNGQRQRRGGADSRYRTDSLCNAHGI